MTWELNLPFVNLRLSKNNDGQVYVFDRLRMKNVILTPEEYVRQNFIAWLINQLHYPESLLANEIGIELNGVKRRCDSIMFHPDGTPCMIIEYKAPNVKINQSVFDQIVRYNMVLKAEYLIVSNGLQHYCCKIDYKTNSYQFIPKVPDYREMHFGVSEN